MAIDLATKIKLVSIDGFAACADDTDRSGLLRVYLLTDTPEMREAVLAIIGNQLTADKVLFERKS
ncbi:MAG: hypothetical protein A2534_02290 [Candidatus Magasanikbacteria bacterium RIFOXYD2_FULL_39_9]|uniref:Uncharacterized protein n=1 Tax=Candidatus Magasanikbacteria bacterium RIFOXYD1_FULL_40_23 TaxID=1798705 RepID=A0A1F6PBM0_9BACT|nr:MAG: hypothetical protein A2534_02290 [Candidatus Magasanikbacteria bacterium RIFOXYD2_FULL_39_9]OGH93354.1 MAG: hypothetical protein A2563_01970 [Candidatus Magasanikbacteria bacterium RIFOXYD1_FULL_40_23]